MKRNTTCMAVKICGVTDAAAIAAAQSGGAQYVGFNFYPSSPRYLTLDRARRLREAVHPPLRLVALVVNAPDSALAEIVANVRPDLIQLHGSESPTRTRAIAQRFGLPVIKALGLAAPENLDHLDEWRTSADMLLFDARDENGQPAGGKGIAFDWHMLKGRTIGLPWMLSGGLTPDNVAAACAASGARMADVSSSLERQRGHKDPKLIAQFLHAARSVTQ